jgi:hypothetical protein
MPIIFTTRGNIDEALLSKTTGADEDERAVAHWEEWRVIGDLSGEIAKRNVHVVLKDGVDLSALQGALA